MRIDREGSVDEETPDLLATLPGVKSLILCVTNATEFFIRDGRLGAIGLADELNHALALIHLQTQHRAQIALFHPEDVLPERLIAQESKSVSHQLARTPQLFTHCGNKNGRSRPKGDEPGAKGPGVKVRSQSRLLEICISIRSSSWDPLQIGSGNRVKRCPSEGAGPRGSSSPRQRCVEKSNDVTEIAYGCGAPRPDLFPPPLHALASHPHRVERPPDPSTILDGPGGRPSTTC